MIKKRMLSLGIIVYVFLLFPELLLAQEIQIVFRNPAIPIETMNNLTWNTRQIKEWRGRPITVNDSLDEMFELDVQVLNLPRELRSTSPRLKICPMPREPESCWEQELYGRQYW